MPSDDFLKELQENYLKISGNRYGALVKHRDLAHVLIDANRETFQYFDEIQKLKSCGAYRFKMFADDRNIALFEPLC